MDHPSCTTPQLDLTIFVACYNEQENVIPTLVTTTAACKRSGCSYEIIVIDDGSRDQTSALVNQFKAENPIEPIRLVTNPRNRGLAYNFVEASFMGRGRYYRLICGDNVEPEETQLAILSKVGQADVVVPYPIRVAGKSPVRQIISRAYTALVNLASGRRLRYWNGCGVYPRYAVMRWHSSLSGLSFQADMLTQLLDMGYSYVEVGCHYTERRAGRATALTLRNFLSVAYCLMMMFSRRIGCWLFGHQERDVVEPCVAAIRAEETDAIPTVASPRARNPDEPRRCDGRSGQ